MRLIGNEAVFLALTTFFGTTVVLATSGWFAIGQHIVTSQEIRGLWSGKDEIVQRLTRVETKLDMIIERNNYWERPKK